MIDCMYVVSFGSRYGEVSGALAYCRYPVVPYLVSMCIYGEYCGWACGVYRSRCNAVSM